jgi:tetratricopeptide (TPR) repeat protein
MAGVSAQQLRRWEERGLVERGDTYGFRDLIALRVLAGLKSKNFSASQIQRAVASIRERLSGIDPLTEVKFYAEGKRIYVRIGNENLDAESGQLVFSFTGERSADTATLPDRSAQERAAEEKRKQQEAERWFLKGVEMEQVGAPPDQILDVYHVAVSLDPQLAAAQVNLGTMYFGLRDLVRAEKYYLRALESNPKYALAWFNLGNLYDELGNSQEASKYYHSALEHDPNYADAHYNLALLCQARGESMKAISHWQTYLKLDPAGPWGEAARRELHRLMAATVVPGRRGTAS